MKTGIRLFFLIGALALLITGCEKINSDSRYEPKFVIEGWIEQNDYPYVLITHNSPFFASLDSAQLSELIIRWAKVTVSDGEKTEVLTSKKDDTYFPPYLYRGTELKGVPGKTYTLTVEYAGNTLTAKTTIPNPVPLDHIWFTPTNNDTLVQLNIRFKDNPDEKNYYKIYTKIQGKKRFTPTLVSNQDDKYFNGKELSLQINKGPENNLTLKNEPYFRKGDTISVKFSSIPVEGYAFWSSFNNEVLNASNPLIGSTQALKSNILGPGLGVWCGYGSSVYQVVANPSVALKK